MQSSCPASLLHRGGEGGGEGGYIHVRWKWCIYIHPQPSYTPSSDKMIVIPSRNAHAERVTGGFTVVCIWLGFHPAARSRRMTHDCRFRVRSESTVSVPHHAAHCCSRSSFGWSGLSSTIVLVCGEIDVGILWACEWPPGSDPHTFSDTIKV